MLCVSDFWGFCKQSTLIGTAPAYATLGTFYWFWFVYEECGVWVHLSDPMVCSIFDPVDQFLSERPTVRVVKCVAPVSCVLNRSLSIFISICIWIDRLKSLIGSIIFANFFRFTVFPVWLIKFVRYRRLIGALLVTPIFFCWKDCIANFLSV